MFQTFYVTYPINYGTTCWANKKNPDNEQLSGFISANFTDGLLFYHNGVEQKTVLLKWQM